jgi:hypothetical protein
VIFPGLEIGDEIFTYFYGQVFPAVCMEIDKFMTAVEFAEKVNTAYPTVDKWLREGKAPGAFRQKIGNMEI